MSIESIPMAALRQIGRHLFTTRIGWRQVFLQIATDGRVQVLTVNTVH